MDLKTYFVGILNQVAMSELDYESAGSAFAKLKLEFGFLFRDVLVDFVPYGSVSRRTCLSRRYNQNFDFDCLFIVHGHMFHNDERFAFQASHSTLPEFIYNKINKNPLFSDPRIDVFTVSFFFKEIKFEVTPCFPGKAYYGSERDFSDLILYKTRTPWELKNLDLIDERIEKGAGPNDEYRRTVSTRPFDLFTTLAGFNDEARTTIQHSILLLKYWNNIHESELPSFYLESSFLEFFTKAKNVSNQISVYDILIRYFESPSLYNSALLGRSREFAAFKSTLLDIHEKSKAEPWSEEIKNAITFLLPHPSHLSAYRDFKRVFAAYF